MTLETRLLIFLALLYAYGYWVYLKTKKKEEEIRAETEEWDPLKEHIVVEDNKQEPEAEKPRIRYTKEGLTFEPSRILSNGEDAFFEQLYKAIKPQYHICMKARLSDLLWCPKYVYERCSYRINQRHVDFVVVERSSLKTKVVIELDDMLHNIEGRQKKDEFLNEIFECAGIQVVRFPAARRYEVEDIKKMLPREIVL